MSPSSQSPELSLNRVHHIFRIIHHAPGEPDHCPTRQHKIVLPDSVGCESAWIRMVLIAVQFDRQMLVLEGDVKLISAAIDVYRFICRPPLDAMSIKLIMTAPLKR
jgi:hypothetical protein